MEKSDVKMALELMAELPSTSRGAYIVSGVKLSRHLKKLTKQWVLDKYFQLRRFNTSTATRTRCLSND